MLVVSSCRLDSVQARHCRAGAQQIRKFRKNSIGPCRGCIFIIKIALDNRNESFRAKFCQARVQFSARFAKIYVAAVTQGEY